MPKSQPFKIVMHYPQTEDGMCQLSQRIAQAHADAVIHQINGAKGSVKEKIELMKAVTSATKREWQTANHDELSR